jgi:hypothetical protein
MKYILAIINYKKISYQYYTQKENKEKFVRDSSSLLCGHRLTTEKISPGRF